MEKEKKTRHSIFVNYKNKVFVSDVIKLWLNEMVTSFDLINPISGSGIRLFLITELQLPVWTGSQGQMRSHFELPIRWCVDCKNQINGSQVMIFTNIKLWCIVIRYPMTSLSLCCLDNEVQLSYEFQCSIQFQSWVIP